jgi:hypothetical protein
MLNKIVLSPNSTLSPALRQSLEGHRPSYIPLNPTEKLVETFDKYMKTFHQSDLKSESLLHDMNAPEMIELLPFHLDDKQLLRQMTLFQECKCMNFHQLLISTS